MDRNVRRMSHGDVQVEKNDPRDNDRQAPLGALNLGANVMDRSSVVRVNVEVNVLEVGGEVEHVEYQSKRSG